MSSGRKSALSRVLVGLLLATALVLLARKTAKKAAPPLPPEPPRHDDDTQPVRPVRRSLAGREQATEREIKRLRQLEGDYPPALTGED